MSLRVPSPVALYQWLHRHDVGYAVLRSDPSNGGDDLDLLIEDDAVPALNAAFPQRRGLKVDVYGVLGHHGSDYHGFGHLPEALARRTLANRQRVGGRFVPAPEDELLGLAYHAAYHKAMQSGLPFETGGDRGAGHVGPYDALIDRAAAAANMPVSRSLRGLHELLEAHGFAADYERLAAYVRHDFHHGRKNYLHAWLMSRAAGELNLFVLRAVAVRHGLTSALLNRLREHFEVLQVKPIGLWARLTRAPHMRGGKWRRGGRPHIAVVVFDPCPELSSPQEREVHPFVFNRRQFAKLEWRAWFAAESGARPRDNPIHSTDNEAEAIGHLPLFFDPAEQAAIMAALAARRSAEGQAQHAA